MSTPSTQVPISYAEYTLPQSTSSNALAELTGLAREQLEAEALVSELKAQLERAEANLKDIAERRMPAMMEALELREFKLQNGTTIEIEERIFASIPKDRRGPAHQWLRDNGSGALVRRKVVMEFGVGEDEMAAGILAYLQDGMASGAVPRTEIAQDEGVNPQSFGKFARDRLREGKALPDDFFSVTRKSIAAVHVPKD